MPADDVIALSEQFNAALLRKDTAALGKIIKAYKGIYTRLQDKLDALVLQIGTDKPTQGQVVRLERYKALLEQAQNELDDFTGYLKTELRTAATDGIALGTNKARAMVGAIVGAESGVMAGFNVLPTQAVERLLGFLAVDGPLYARIAKLAPTTVDRIAAALVEGVGLGHNPRKIAAGITRELGMGLTDALRMTRTAQLYSYREASRATYMANPSIVEGWIWMAAIGDPRTCLSCIAMHGSLHPLSEKLDDHFNGRCLTPGTLVSSPFIESFVSRRYDGEIISIRTASGKFLTVTPNHPILTDRGWRAARLIQKGDNIISYGGSEWTALGISPHKDHVPTLIENIPTALGMNHFGSVPTSPQDFHGDGNVNRNFDVYIVWPNSFLRNRDGITFIEPGAKKFFGRGYAESNVLPTLGYLGPMFLRMSCAPTTILSDFDSAQQVGAGGAGNHKPIRFGIVPQRHAVISQSNIDNISGCPAKFSQGIDGFASKIPFGDIVNRERQGETVKFSSRDFTSREFVSLGFIPKQSASLEFIREALFASAKSSGTGFGAFARDVILDCVLEVGIRSFSGHVYNLKTSVGWYNADGIITHNCTEIPAVVGSENPIDSDGEKWFTSLSEAQQREMMGKSKYDLWKQGAFSFGDLSKVRENDVYGGMRGVATIAELLGTESRTKTGKPLGR